jgi:hypothetical protein
MAAPVTHILLAFQILPSLPDKDIKEFIIGTSFPDIRYLNCISREKTHVKNITLDDIKREESSFKAGMMFHALVDEIRDKFMKENNIYSLVPKSMVTPHALKFNEDILLFNKISNWNNISEYFDTILPEELALVKNEYLQTWHKAIKRYISNFLIEKNRFKFLKRCAKRRFGIIEKTFLNNIKRSALVKVNEILYAKLERLINAANTNLKIKELVDKFYVEFINLL